MVFVILAGGLSRRMGTDKLLLKANSGLTLTEDAVNRFVGHGSVMLSVNDASRFPEVTIPKITDNYPGIGPLGGLQAVLSAVRDDVFLIAADMPFASPEAAERIIELSRNYDAGTILSSDGKFEPLFAYYSHSILPVIESLITEGIYKMGALLRRVNTRKITPSELGSLWSENLLYNINNPNDYKQLTTNS